MSTQKCNVCGSSLHKKIYDSGNSLSLTSLCTTLNSRTEVYACQSCSHVQSVPIRNLKSYYDLDYNILVESEDEDQIYEVVMGNKIYRTDHQVNVMLDKLLLKAGTRILDYGCAKSSTMRALSKLGLGCEVFLFDVSDRYRAFWDNFVSVNNYATYDLPDDWQGTFDIVTSFFSLEHIEKPQDALINTKRVLRNGGILYGVVPSFLSNSADLIVVDHVNHFTPLSLYQLLNDNGFLNIDIDDISHKGAIVFSAQKSDSEDNCSIITTSLVDASSIVDKAQKIGHFWQHAGERVRAFEKSLDSDAKLAIYGAGFYGSFIMSWLSGRFQVDYVLDQNPFMHGRKINCATVMDPTCLPADVNTLLVGLNPSHAKQVIQEVTCLKNRSLNIFYLQD